MVGREIRATVVQAEGGPNGLIQLRSGGTLIEARATGAPLRPGQQLFLKIEQPQSGTYRLVVLEPGGPGSGAGIPSLLAQNLPPGPLQHLFGTFLRFYSRANQGRSEGTIGRGAAQASSAGAAASSAAPGGVGFAAGAVAGRMLDSLNRLAGRVPHLEQGALAQILQSLARPEGAGEPPDFWLGQGWATESADEESLESPAEEYFAALGRLAEPPYYFLSDFKLEATGRIGVLVLSPDADFRRVSLFLHPERHATAAWLETEVGRLRREVGDSVHWERIEVLGPGDSAAEAGGGLLDLQG